jgi:hypothetical protein
MKAFIYETAGGGSTVWFYRCVVRAQRRFEQDFVKYLLLANSHIKNNCAGIARLPPRGRQSCRLPGDRI